MKNFQNTPHPAEVGAGTGLLLVCGVCMALDFAHLEIYLPLSGIGIMMLTGIFSSKSGKKCAQKETDTL